ncbi:MAG: hypothetical protein MK364_03430 [Pirellulales bacterium]|nr:hypothetical protein [Pirellulales bacterium]
MIRFVVIVLCLLRMAVGAPLTDSAEGSDIVIDDDFEEWTWEPITFSMRKSGRTRLKAGKRLPFEYRGPLYRVAQGFELPSGRMVTGAGAFRGRSVMLEDCQIGLHDRYSRLIDPKVSYRYQIAVRGTGTFHFRAWVGATNPATGKFRWLGFPDLIKIEATKSWRTYTGTFRLPEFDTATYQISGKVSAAIVVEEKHQIVIDEFTISRPKLPSQDGPELKCAISPQFDTRRVPLAAAVHAGRG